MKLSLSCRIAEGFLKKDEASMSLKELADLAVAAGYDAVCMRSSQIGIHSSTEQIQRAREILDQRDLTVSMISGDFDIVYNNERGPLCLRNVAPYLDLADALGAPLIRVCLKTAEDIEAAQRASDEAVDRGLNLVHQCHALSLFETVDQIEATLQKIDRPNFGLIYEAANLEECRQDYGPATIRRLAPWIRNVYVQNQKLNPDGAITLDTWSHGPISFDIIQIDEAGGIDFASVFSGLREIGCDGLVTVHQSAPAVDTITPLQSAARTAEFLRSFY